MGEFQETLGKAASPISELGKRYSLRRNREKPQAGEEFAGNSNAGPFYLERVGTFFTITTHKDS